MVLTATRSDDIMMHEHFLLKSAIIFEKIRVALFSMLHSIQDLSTLVLSLSDQEKFKFITQIRPNGKCEAVELDPHEFKSTISSILVTFDQEFRAFATSINTQFKTSYINEKFR